MLVSLGDVIIASSPAPLCDGDSHDIQVTLSGNQTLLLVDGKAGRSEDADIPFDILSQSSIFIGGLPGEDTSFYKHMYQIHAVCGDLFAQYKGKVLCRCYTHKVEGSKLAVKYKNNSRAFSLFAVCENMVL